MAGGAAVTAIPPDARALTIRQPWASLIALGVKTIETRGWSTAYRGPLVIHAGKSTDTWRELDLPTLMANRATVQAVLEAFDVMQPDGSWWTPVVCEDFIDLGPTGQPPLPCHERCAVLPLGAVVAVVDLVDVVPIVDYMTEREDVRRRVEPIETASGGTLWLRTPGQRPAVDISDQLPYGDFTPGRYAWLLDNVRPVDPPIPAKGRQGLWRWTP